MSQDGDAGGGQRRMLYGRRRGKRLRVGRQALLEELLPKLTIPLPEAASGALVPPTLFPRRVDDVWLEIGFGAGEHLAQQAAAHPDVGFIGAEPYLNGVARLVSHAAERRLDNIRLLPDDARLLLPALGEASIGRAFLLFPDPWPKLRHHKRRFVSDATVDCMARILKDGAEWRMATDDMDYCRWMLAHLTRHDDFDWQARRPGDWRRRPADWPATRYEEKALAAGRRCIYLTFRRRARGGGASKA